MIKMRCHQEDQTEAQVGGLRNGVEPDQIQPVRRSTRIKRPASEWRAYFNAKVVAHPTSAIYSLAQYPEEHQVFIGVMIKNDTWFETQLPVGTEIHTVDFRLNKESNRTLVSQRSRISANTTRQAIRTRNKDDKR